MSSDFHGCFGCEGRDAQIAELTREREMDAKETLALVDRVDAADRERTRSNHRANIAEARAKKLEVELDLMVSYLKNSDQDANHEWMFRHMKAALADEAPKEEE